MNKIPLRSEEIFPVRTSAIDVKKIILNTLAVLLAIFMWQAASLWIHADVLIASPLQVLRRVFELLQSETFAAIVLRSAGHITAGFFLALGCAVVLAAAAGRFPVLEIFFRPFLLTVKTVPVASFIVISLIWLSGNKLSVFISFLMALPILYNNLLQGYKNTDPKMLQCADLFHFSFFKRFLLVRFPAVKPFLLSACSTGMGLAWKAGIAAEVIGIPKDSIGEMLYYAKLYFDSKDLFAWTLIIVILSVGIEKLFLLLLKVIFAGLEKKI